jgi:hypothetical protein
MSTNDEKLQEMMGVIEENSFIFHNPVYANIVTQYIQLITGGKNWVEAKNEVLDKNLSEYEKKIAIRENILTQDKA